jgi:hypothetical protein
MTVENVSRHIPRIVETALWSVAAGRCEICHKKLYVSSMTGQLVNISQKAHIRAFSPNGPRYSESQNNPHELDNLMLLCAEHHKLIDTNPEDFPTEWLMQQKKDFEEKVDAVIDTQRTKSSILSFNSIITKKDDIKSEEAEFSKILLFNENYFDGKFHKIDANLSGIEHNSMYYSLMCQSIKEQFENIKAAIRTTETLSVFAIAPQPLLLYLGYLLNDETNIKVFQRFRTGNLKWNWKTTEQTNNFSIEQLYAESSDSITEVNLVLSVSAEITLDRILLENGQGNEIPTLIVRAKKQDFDAIQSSKDADEFITFFRKNVIEKIRQDFPYLQHINIYPATPVSIPVRIGMNYQKNVDVEWKIFNQEVDSGFVYALSLKGEK